MHWLLFSPSLCLLHVASFSLLSFFSPFALLFHSAAAGRRSEQTNRQRKERDFDSVSYNAHMHAQLAPTRRDSERTVGRGPATRRDATGCGCSPPLRGLDPFRRGDGDDTAMRVHSYMRVHDRMMSSRCARTCECREGGQRWRRTTDDRAGCWAARLASSSAAGRGLSVSVHRRAFECCATRPQGGRVDGQQENSDAKQGRNAHSNEGADGRPPPASGR